jgi:hypothetical protein
MLLEVRRYGALDIEFTRPVAVAKLLECCVDLRNILGEDPLSGTCDASAYGSYG